MVLVKQNMNAIEIRLLYLKKKVTCYLFQNHLPIALKSLSLLILLK